jgi:hypothetical protein
VPDKGDYPVLNWSTTTTFDGWEMTGPRNYDYTGLDDGSRCPKKKMLIQIRTDAQKVAIRPMKIV